jgi:SAM-dependent methyltransferase
MSYHATPAGHTCPLCGGEGAPVGQKEGATLRECGCVGRVLLAWPWQSEDDYASLYLTPRVYHEEEQRREGQRPSVERDTEHLRACWQRLTLLRQFIPEGQLLDVGAGTGALVAQAAAFGYEALGLEPSHELAAWARRQGRRVEQGGWTVAGVSAQGGPWDLITLTDVLEHLTRPVDALRHLAELLAPGGALFVEWPEWGCPQATQQGLQWKHVRPRQHPALYDDDAARALFRLAGLGVEGYWRPCRGALGKAAYVLTPEAD